ncbi:hypothetical protein ACPCSA_34500, partial [Streptomyces lavendulocolor]
MIKPLLAPPRMGRPVRDRRQVLNGDLPYELCVLVALRDALRRREIWVVGARSCLIIDLVVGRGELTDAAWGRIARLLPGVDGRG